MLDVITIGAATADIFVRSSAFRLKRDLTSLTDYSLSVDYSSKNEIQTGLITSGGGATNAAVSLARLGLKVAPICLIGGDILSQVVLADLAAAKVNPDFLIQKKIDTTDYSVILVGPDGGRTILTNRGRTSLTSASIHFSRIDQPQWFYITSLEGNLDLLEKIIGFAHEHQIKVSLNPGNRELARLSLLKPLLPYVDFLLLNKTEAQILIKSNYTDRNFWSKLKRVGSPFIAVTKGREGAHILTPDGDYFSPILNVKPVDETGAGDAFGSTFVAALCHQQSNENALSWAIHNSASVVAHLGAKPGLLTLKELHQSFKKTS